MNRTLPAALGVLAGLAIGGPSPAIADDDPSKTAAAAAPAEEAPADGEEMVLEGGSDGTVFRSLTVTGEDRMHIDFDRPELRLDLDPQQAAGLDWGDAADVLAVTGIDTESPLRGSSLAVPSRYQPRPWIDRYRTDTVARFRPDLEGAERWQLTVADSRSDTVAVFSGKGNPPEEIAWNGLARDGSPVPSGVTCSYVLQATDRAGNTRSFVGEGFQLPSYRVETDDATMLLFPAPAASAIREDAAPPEVAEAVSRINQLERGGGAVEVKVTASSFGEAKNLADRIAAVLTAGLVGESARVRAVTQVRPDAPRGGTVAITARRGSA
ncbi:MAG TPA: hypothetical protein VKU85_02105 [bacterium]|nr:hypothetical protein [bacterium]